MDKRTVCVYDFDGTITFGDTLLQFIRFARGDKAFISGFARHALPVMGYKVGLYPNWKAKQRIFSHFFKGMMYSEFRELGLQFSESLDKNVRPRALASIKDSRRRGSRLYVVSASMEEWIGPWCDRNGIHKVLCTRAEVDMSGRLTGRFLGNNCYGREKLERLLQEEPDRSAYKLLVYGDSRGDRELIAFADQGWYNKFR